MIATLNLEQATVTELNKTGAGRMMVSNHYSSTVCLENLR